MKWLTKKKAQWPIDEMPREYFKDDPTSPTLGALSLIIISLANAVKRLEDDVEDLKRRVHNMEIWP